MNLKNKKKDNQQDVEQKENPIEQQTEQENTNEDNGEKTDEQTEQVKTETKEDKLEALGIKLTEVNDKYLRLYSEFENYRKRTSKERLDLIANAGEELIKELLPVIDDYQRALDSVNNIEDEQLKKTLEGLTLIYKKLYSVLERKGLKPINAKGTQFDENLHEAIAQMPAQKEEDKGMVIDETTKGYYLNDKVIRYSKVVVAV